jgi:Holliday junction resolvase
MGAKSKQKGNRYERRCVQLLSEFTGVPFRRIPSSGAFNKFGGAKVAEYVFSGDVISDNKDFIFSVEAKSQKVFSFVAMLKNPKTSAFTEWWKQCVGDAGSVSRLPMLMFKPDSQEDFVALNDAGVNALGIPGSAPHFSIEIYSDIINLSAPKIFKWKTIIESTKPEKMFGGQICAADDHQQDSSEPNK